MNTPPLTAPHPAVLDQAVAKTTKVVRSLDVASAELILTNEVLSDALHEDVKGDPVIERVLEHNLEVEARVQSASQELATVTQLLKAEQAHTEKLEKIIEKSTGQQS